MVDEVVEESVSEIDQLEIIPDNVFIQEYRAMEVEGFGEVIKYVMWTYNWTHPNYPGTTLSSGFTSRLDEPDADNFLNLDDVTEDILKRWVLERETNSLDYVKGHIMEQFPIEYEIQQTTVYTFV